MEKRSIKFEDLKGKILTALKEKFTGGNGNFTLVDGFFFSPMQKETGSFQLGGPSIPQVVIVNTSTGEVRYFALKVLLPDEKYE